MQKEDMVIFSTWTLSAITLLGLGGHMMLSKPAWVLWFPTPALAFISVLVLPTSVLTFIALRWIFVEESRE